MLLAKILNQDIPEGTTFACVGKPGSGKTSLCFKLAYEHIQRKRNVVYLTTENTPSRLIELHRGLGMIPESGSDELLHFIDAHSWKVGAKGEGIASKMISNPGNFSEVSLAIDATSKDLPGGSLIIIDSLSGLMLSAPDETRIKNFFHVLSQRLNQKGYITIAVIEEGCHDSKLIFGLRALAQSSIIVRMQEGENGHLSRELRLTDLLGYDTDTRWYKVLISQNGPELGG